MTPILEPLPDPDPQDLLGWRLGGAVHDLDLHPEGLLNPLLAASSVARIRPRLGEAQQTISHGVEQVPDPILVRELRSVDADLDHQPFGIHQKVALPDPHLLAPVEAALLATDARGLAACASTIPALG